MDDQFMSGWRLSRRQFAKSVLALTGGASFFSAPALRWIMAASTPNGYFTAPQAGQVGSGVLLLVGAPDARTQAMAEWLAQDGTVAFVSTANNQVEARAAVHQLLTHPQLAATAIGVIGIGAGAVQALYLAHNHSSVGAAVLVGNLPASGDWQSDFALLQERGAKTLILPGELDESVWAQAGRFVKQYSV
jgi:dienelactone hydrolase